MHAIELVDVAGVLCLGAQSLLEDCPRVEQGALVEYWTASRCRLDEWGRALRRFGRPAAETHCEEFESLAEEILLSQPHTRAMAALGVLHDARWGDTHESGVIARNVLAGHEEALRRLGPLLSRPAGPRPVATQNGTAARACRWTDLLLGYLLPNCGRRLHGGVAGDKDRQGHVIEFAFDAQRVLDFAYDAHAHSGDSAPEAQRLLTASLRLSLSGATAPPANPDANRRIAGASLGLFGPEAFDDFGLLRSTMSRRLERSTDETLGMLEDLFTEPPAAKPLEGRF
jgi:hypothetical protein